MRKKKALSLKILSKEESHCLHDEHFSEFAYSPTTLQLYISGCYYLHQRSNQVHKSCSIEIYYQCGMQQTQSNMLLELFVQVIGEPCFNILRTKEQLGQCLITNKRKARWLFLSKQKCFPTKQWSICLSSGKYLGKLFSQIERDADAFRSSESVILYSSGMVSRDTVILLFPQVIGQKTVVCIMPIRSYTQSAKVDLNLWPCDPNSTGFFLTIHNLHFKFESDWTKTAVCIMPTNFIHRAQKLTLTFDLITQNQ